MKEYRGNMKEYEEIPECDIRGGWGCSRKSWIHPSSPGLKIFLIPRTFSRVVIGYFPECDVIGSGGTRQSWVHHLCEAFRGGEFGKAFIET